MKDNSNGNRLYRTGPSSNLPFHFNQKQVARLPSHLVYYDNQTKEDGLNLPRVALLYPDEIASLRRRQIQDPNAKRKLRSDNAPVVALTRLRLKKITPEKDHLDPYVVGVLIAMAQAQGKALKRVDHETWWQDRETCYQVS